MNQINYTGKHSQTTPTNGVRLSHNVYPTKYMVVTGDLEKGFQFYGLFISEDAAREWVNFALALNASYSVQPFSDVGGQG